MFQCFWSTWRCGFRRKRSTSTLYLCGTTSLCQLRYVSSTCILKLISFILANICSSFVFDKSTVCMQILFIIIIWKYINVTRRKECLGVNEWAEQSFWQTCVRRACIFSSSVACFSIICKIRFALSMDACLKSLKQSSRSRYASVLLMCAGLPIRARYGPKSFISCIITSRWLGRLFIPFWKQIVRLIN